MKFIKATFLGHQTVRFESENGELVDHIGGNWTWRNNNPGNIIKGPFANKCGAIGHAGGFAVFPSANIGELALKKLLKTKKYQEEKISTLFEHYAPEQDGNNPKNYVKLVRQFTGIKSDLLLKELTEKEFEKFISAIKRVEGQKVGNIVPVKMKRILKAKEEKNVIVAYLIEEYGWVNKSRAIEFAKNGIIDCVIVENKNGVYLRSRPDETTSNNLKKK